MSSKTIYGQGHPGRFALCIDWETSGSTFGGDSSKDYQGLSFGAVIFDTATFEPVETLYRELKFDASKYKWSAEAEAIHGLSQDYLAKNGVDREEALVDLLDLIMRHIGTGKIFLMGHNNQFDKDFTNQLANDFDVELQFHHVNIDTSGLGFVAIGEYKSDAVFKFFCDADRKEHNALEDALITLTVVRNIRALIDSALGK